MFLFLDIDGVLNNFGSLQKLSPSSRFKRSKIPLERDCIEELNRILSATGARVILSSGWKESRKLSELEKTLRASGFQGMLVDQTPSVKGATRGDEIRAWLEQNNSSSEAFVILDDRGDIKGFDDFFVQTSFYKGLTPTEADRAIAILNS
jgi:hypothetical protein